MVRKRLKKGLDDVKGTSITNIIELLYTKKAQYETYAGTFNEHKSSKTPVD